MKRLTPLIIAASAMFAATAANAGVTVTPGTNIVGPPSTNFSVTGNPAGNVSATFGRAGLPATASDTDKFTFTILTNGLGSGTISTSLAGIAGGATDLDFLSVRFSNDAGATFQIVPTTSLLGNEFGGLSNVPIFNGVLNILEVTYRSRGNGSYGGSLSFSPLRQAVPEASTWAMMILGLGAVGFAMRRSRKEQVRVRYAF